MANLFDTSFTALAEFLTEISNTRDTLNTQADTITNQTNQINDLQGQINSANQQVNNLTQQLSNLTQQNSNLNNQITTLDNQVTTLSTSMTLAQKQQRLVGVAKGLIGMVNYVVYTQRQEDVPPYKTDCSGFTYLVYKMSGVLIPFPPTSVFNRAVADQINTGTAINLNDETQWAPGDLLLMSIPADQPATPGAPTHVGMYIGNGQFIHNQNPTMNVNVANVSDWQKYFVSVRRIITQ